MISVHHLGSEAFLNECIHVTDEGQGRSSTKAVPGLQGKAQNEYLKVRGTKFSSCFAIAGAKRLKVDDRGMGQG